MTFNDKYKNNVLLIKTSEFALKIITYTEILQENKKFVVANQLLKAEHQLEQILKKLKMQKVKQILYIN